MRHFLFKNIFILLFLSAFTNLNAQIFVSLPDTTAFRNDPIDVPIYASEITNSVTLYQFKVDFDKDILRVVGVEQSNTLTDYPDWKITIEKNDDNIIVRARGDRSLSGSGVLLYLKFQVENDVSGGDISPLNFDYFRFNIFSFPFAYTSNGSVRIIDQLNLSVEKSGDGEGNIIVNGEEQNLPFSNNFEYGSLITLTASPSTGSEFLAWDGDVFSENETITLTLNQDINLIAEFRKLTYTINSAAEPSNGGTTSGSGRYKYGETANLSATPNTGWEFVNWTEGESVVSNDQNYSFTVTDNRNLTAHFQLRNYSIICSANPSEGGVTEGCGNYKFGETANLTATANTGYDFVNWTENGNEISKERNISFIVTRSRNLVANFELQRFTIDCSANPSSAGTTEGCGRFNYGQQITVSANPSEGWNFTNWTENGSIVSTDQDYTFTVNRYRNLTANFSERSFTINCSANPSAGGTTSGCGTFKFNEEITVTATANTGWSFVNWTENGNEVSTDPSYQFRVRGDRNLTANFEINSYTINCSSNPSEGGSTEGCGGYDYGQTATLRAVPSTGWSFVNWTENGSEVSTNSSYSFTVNSSRNLTANFSINSYTINCSPVPENGGTTSGCGTFEYGTEITLNAAANQHYDFLNWTENGNVVSENPNYTFTVAGNRNLTANFSLETHEISCSVNPPEGGATSGCGIFEYGTETTLTAEPNEGWAFINWTIGENVVSSNSEYTFTVTAPVEVLANFEKVTYSINCSSLPTSGGVTSGCGFFYYNQNATLNAIPSAGFVFENWMEDGKVISELEQINFKVKENRNIVANFSREELNILCASNPPEGGVTSGCGFFYYDQMATLTALPNDGWTFLNWTYDDSILSSNSTFSFKVKESREIKANFQFVTSVKDLNFENSIPDEYFLANNYPNPFNPTTKIAFGLPFESEVILNIYDIKGQLIQEIIDGEYLPAGKYTKTIHLDNFHSGLASGIYFYRILAQSQEGKSFSSVKKMLYLK